MVLYRHGSSIASMLHANAEASVRLENCGLVDFEKVAEYITQNTMPLIFVIIAS